MWPRSCEGFSMILLVTPNDRASECAAALHAATGEEVAVTESLTQATTMLRAEDYLALIFDQYLLEAEPHQAEITFGHLGSAIPVQVNLAISGVERLVREVRAALQRRQREQVSIREAALGKLRSELNGTVTALLLYSELALEAPGLPAAATETLQSVHDLVKRVRDQLENTSPDTREEAYSLTQP